MADDLSELVALLHVEQLDTCLFRGYSPAERNRRVYGGQVLAQAMNAALRTVDPARRVHSQHAYFLRPGDPTRPIIYEVDPIRDGRRFSTRRVVARQGGRAIFNTSLSFQAPVPGLEHQRDMPQTCTPESLESGFSYYTRMAELHPERHRAPRRHAIDYRPIEYIDSSDPGRREPRFGVWMRANGTLDDDPAVHAALLAYMSDSYLLSTSLLPHAYAHDSPGMETASMDHAMWFYADFRADQWLYYDLESPRAAGGRGFNLGYIHTREGVLVATSAQEGLMQLGDAD